VALTASAAVTASKCYFYSCEAFTNWKHPVMEQGVELFVQTSEHPVQRCFHAFLSLQR